MSQYGISAVSYNARHTQIARCVLHTIEFDNRGVQALSDGIDVPHTEVAALIARGDQVWVMTMIFNGSLQPDGPVVTYGEHKYLFSAEGDAIFGLPEYEPLS